MSAAEDPVQETHRPLDPRVAAATAGRFIPEQATRSSKRKRRRRPQQARAPPSDAPLPLALRYTEAAKLIGVIRQVHNLANAGVLKRVRFGKRCTRITTASVIALIGE